MLSEKIRETTVLKKTVHFPVIKKFLEKRKIKKIEAGLDTFLLLLALELELNPVIETAFNHARQHVPSPLHESLETIVFRMNEQGMTFEQSLEKWSRDHPSIVMRSVTSSMIHLSRQGTTHEGINGLRQRAEDLRTKHYHEIKTFGSKMALWSLVFIGVSALVPSLFLAFILVGSRFLELTITPNDIILATLIGFPAMDATVLGMVLLQIPPSMHVATHSSQKNSKKNSLVQEDASSIEKRVQKYLTNLHQKCLENGIKGGLHQLLLASTMEGAGFFLVGWSAYLYFSTIPIFWELILFSCAFGPLLVNLAAQEVAFELKLRKISNQVPESLLTWAALPPSVSFEKGVEWIADQSELPILEEWITVQSRIQKGESFSNAIQKMGEKFELPLLEKMKHVLVRGYESGWPIYSACATLARDGMSLQSLNEERRTAVLVEKYTLLIAGGIMVPLLLGILVGVVSNLTFTETGGETLFDTALWGVQGYLFIYGIIAGIFIAYQDNRPRAAGGYILFLVAGTQLLFSIGRYVL